MKIDKRINYVCGFLFSQFGKSTSVDVALVWKDKPTWQAGHLNGIGGKIKEDETPAEAMSREFKEETGIDIPKWNCFCVLYTRDAIIYFYAQVAEQSFELQGQESEEIGWHDVLALTVDSTIPNLHWLIPMALLGNHGLLDDPWPYIVHEKPAVGHGEAREQNIEPPQPYFSRDDDNNQACGVSGM